MWSAAQLKKSRSRINNAAASPNTKTFGMTSAISMDAPKPLDLIKTDELREALKKHNIFESEQELNHREEILNKLNALAKKWVYDTSVAQNIPPYAAEKAGGRIQAFGSYKLGVHHKGADIDALCVVPFHINRTDYFGSFFNLLKARPEVTNLRGIEEAYVPVIKMKFDGVEVDMVFAKLGLSKVPDSIDLRDNNLLRYLDQRCIRSLNGCRVTEEILRLVPNVENFRFTSRAIKLWAKKNGIYNNALGYLGGVSWAMLVARTCQLYPNAAPATLIEKFFLIFSLWKWPLPMLLRSPDTSSLGYEVWDPRINLSDRSHLMPIITPSYPQQNSTFNVSVSTRTIMQEAIEAGLAITKEIIAGTAKWDQLFDPPNFFGKYKHYIVLFASSSSLEDQLQWSGLVESKIRHLVRVLEKNPNITLAHINPESFPPLKPEEGKSSSIWFIGLVFKRVENLSIDLTHDIKNFVESTKRQAEQIKGFENDVILDGKYAKKKDLASYISPTLVKKERKTSSESLSNDNVSGNGGVSSSKQNDQIIRKRKLEQNLDVNNKKTKPNTSEPRSIGR